MKEQEFRNYLENDKAIKSDKVIASRIAKGKKAEDLLQMDFDDIVVDDDRMFNALKQLQTHEPCGHGSMQNALRKYYELIRGKKFPRKKNYHAQQITKRSV